MDIIDKNPRNYEVIYKNFKIEENKDKFSDILEIVRKYRNFDEDLNFFEVGTGNGWFQILCKMNGIECEGIDIVKSNVEFAKKLGKSYGYDLNISLGSIENSKIGNNKYDVIVAFSVFEHVKNWRKGIFKIFNALKPNGLFLFLSTNKFSPKSEEYDFPLYGWFPNKIRYKLRIRREGPEVMKCGIDYNQFTYIGLKKSLLKLGFSRVIEPYDFIDLNNLDYPKPLKLIFKVGKNLRMLRDFISLFLPITYLVCIK
jgi:SAM-dependent methyltransferase